MARANRIESASSGPYATAADFEQIFTEDMGGFFLLSFLLTGSRDKAEKCFVTGIGESVRGNNVFREWGRSWARRTIILSAIRLIDPRQHSENGERGPAAVQTIDKLPLASKAEVSSILELPPFQRFVFVMSVLERYSDHECSILLGCAAREMTAARTRALQRLGRLIMIQKNESDTGYENSATYENPGPVIELTIARYFTMPTGTESFPMTLLFGLRHEFLCNPQVTAFHLTSPDGPHHEPTGKGYIAPSAGKDLTSRDCVAWLG